VVAEGSRPMSVTGRLKLIEALLERFDGAPVGESQSCSNTFKKELRAFLEPSFRQQDATASKPRNRVAYVAIIDVAPILTVPIVPPRSDKSGSWIAT